MGGSGNPYAKLFEERIIFLGSKSTTPRRTTSWPSCCLEQMDTEQDISVYINSPGGSYTAMTAIYDTMQFVKPQIQTVCLGQAASAAAVLLAAGTPGKSSPCPIRGSRSTSRTARARAKAPTSRSRPTRSFACATRWRHPCPSPKQSVEDIRRDIERDKILTAEQARMGIIDQVIASRKRSERA